MGDLLWRDFLVPEPQLLRSRCGLPREGHLAGIGETERVWIGRDGRDVSQRAIRVKSKKLRVKAIPRKGEQPAISRPSIVKNWPVHAGTGEILRTLATVLHEHQVVWRRTIFAAADERYLLAIRGDADVAERSTRSENLRHRVCCFAINIRHAPDAQGKNALSVLI